MRHLSEGEAWATIIGCICATILGIVFIVQVAGIFKGPKPPLTDYQAHMQWCSANIGNNADKIRCLEIYRIK